MTVLHADTARGVLATPIGLVPVAIGRCGAVPAAAKREGDGMTPQGVWRLLAVLLRPDRWELGAPPALPWRWIRPDDGWSDDPVDPSYNRPVRLPHPFSAERLWRDDGAYDAVVVLDHNLTRPEPGLGSAIFLHLATARGFTEGCLAIGRAEMAALLPRLAPGDSVRID